MVTRRKISIILLSLAALVALIIVYYNIDPAQARWMPKCPSRLITGLDCPGCGFQRALHAMLHGDIAAAWALNPFLFFGVSYLLLIVWGGIKSLPGSALAYRVSHHRIAIFGYITLYFAWWIIRNL